MPWAAWVYWTCHLGIIGLVILCEALRFCSCHLGNKGVAVGTCCLGQLEGLGYALGSMGFGHALGNKHGVCTSISQPFGHALDNRGFGTCRIGQHGGQIFIKQHVGLNVQPAEWARECGRICIAGYALESPK
jgi:hypothetical protein